MATTPRRCHYALRPYERPNCRLTDAHHQLTTAADQLIAAVTRARQHHTSWTAIATALGTTRQAAQQRFSAHDIHRSISDVLAAGSVHWPLFRCPVPHLL